MDIYCLILLNLLIKLVISEAEIVILGADSANTYLFINDAILAYQLEAPDITLNMQTGTPTFNQNLMFSNSVDFAIMSRGLTINDQQLHPNLALFPFLAEAIVPIYRLDSLGPLAPSLVFTRSLLAQIYVGQITWWNDTQIREVNPKVIMPNKTITVVIDSTQSSNNRVFTAALCKFSTDLCTKIPASNQPSWPINDYATVLIVTQSEFVASTVTTQDNSIAYTILPAAIEARASVGLMINSANQTIPASASSTNFAVMELATKPFLGGFGSIDLNDASGASAWPINIMSYVLIDLDRTRDTCAIREATVEFWLFIYQSPVVAELAQRRQYALIPDQVLTVFNTVQNLVSGVMCDGQQVVTNSIKEQLVISGTDRLSFLTSLLVNLYNTPTDTVNYVYMPQSSQVVWNRLINAETDVAIFYQNELDPTTTAGLQSDSDFLIMPAFLTSIAAIFNPQITPTVNIGSDTIILDISTYFRLFFGNITDWRDPAILKYNQKLAAQLGNQSAPVISVSGCRSTPIVTDLFIWATNYGRRFDPSITTLLAQMATDTALMTGFATCVPAADHRLIYALDEATTSSLVGAISGSVGYSQSKGPSTKGYFTLLYPGLINEQIQLTPRSLDPDTMIACTSDSFDPSSLLLNLEASQDPTCWPLTMVAYLAIRRSYTGKASDTSQCGRGLKALQFVNWVLTNELLDVAARSQSSPRPATVPKIQSAITERLDAVTCDGTTMLVTLPVIWSLSTRIRDFAIAMSIIGLLTILVGLVIVFLFRKNPVIRSTSPWFILRSLIGIGLMFIGALFLVSNPTLTNCRAVAWFLDLGFTLTFVPLFAKAWRIYRIFARKKLGVIKISDLRLAMMVGSFMFIEVVILSTWQAVSPLQPVTTIQQSGDPIMDYQYTQCGTLDPGQNFLIVIGVTKGVLLVYGALLAFGTRRVTDHFNESQSIAWAIYNVILSIGVGVLVIGFVGILGDARVVLMLLVTLWISYFTALIITVPKFLVLFSPSKTVNISAVSEAMSSVAGFSFLSVAEMTQPALLQQYQAALTSQLGLVVHKLEQITATKQRPAPKQAEVSVLSTGTPRVSKLGRSPENQIHQDRSSTSPIRSAALSSPVWSSSRPRLRSYQESRNEVLLESQPSNLVEPIQSTDMQTQMVLLQRSHDTILSIAELLIRSLNRIHFLRPEALNEASQASFCKWLSKSQFGISECSLVESAKLMDSLAQSSDSPGLPQILAHPVTLEIFKDVMYRAHCAENLYFLIRLREWKAIKNVEERRSMAIVIWQDFLTRGCRNEINVSASVKSHLRKKIVQPRGPDLDLHLFDEAEWEVSNLVETNNFKNFINSNDYSLCVQILLEDQSAINRLDLPSLTTQPQNHRQSDAIAEWSHSEDHRLSRASSQIVEEVCQLPLPNRVELQDHKYMHLKPASGLSRSTSAHSITEFSTSRTSTDQVRKSSSPDLPGLVKTTDAEAVLPQSNSP
jgi:phosphate transport system substrate-binding protein